MKIFLAALSALFCLSTVAQDAFPLWKNGAPGALGTEPKDIPTLTPFLPAPGKRNGASVVICPGGSYANLAEHEGPGYAQWLAPGASCHLSRSPAGRGGRVSLALLGREVPA